MSEIVNDIVRLVADSEALRELRKKHCEAAKLCQRKKRAQELGISLEEYLATMTRGRQRVYHNDEERKAHSREYMREYMRKYKQKKKEEAYAKALSA